jgi:hypothetical protein
VGDAQLPPICVQLVCTDAERIRPWTIEVVDGRVRRVSRGLCPAATTVVSHSVTVGWRLLGLSVRGFHRLDELVVEQLVDGRWARHPVPPLDEGLIDLSTPNHPSVIEWHERVIDSPIGTLYVSRRLAAGQLRIFAASTKPALAEDGVGSDIAWRDVMGIRRPGETSDVVSRRAWRGRDAEVGSVRSALLCGRHLPERPPLVRARRDRALLDGLQALRAMRRALRGNPAWRELWRPSARPMGP